MNAPTTIVRISNYEIISDGVNAIRFHLVKAGIPMAHLGFKLLSGVLYIKTDPDTDHMVYEWHESVPDPKITGRSADLVVFDEASNFVKAPKSVGERIKAISRASKAFVEEMVTQPARRTGKTAKKRAAEQAKKRAAEQAKKRTTAWSR